MVCSSSSKISRAQFSGGASTQIWVRCMIAELGLTSLHSGSISNLPMGGTSVEYLSDRLRRAERFDLLTWWPAGESASMRRRKWRVLSPGDRPLAAEVLMQPSGGDLSFKPCGEEAMV